MASSKYHVCQFQAKQITLTFSAQICPKMDFGFQNFKNLRVDSESAPPRDHVWQFSVKINNFEIFGLNLGKLPYYVQYFGSNNVEGVAEVKSEVGGWNKLAGGWNVLGGGGCIV